ncbi:MAG: SAM-dependent methyltransferase [bacterium]
MDEYIKMFSLTRDELRLKILSCADGPASFNSELTKYGGVVTSVDPIYQFTAFEIKQRIDEAYEEVLQQTHQNKDAYVWENISSVEELGKIRMAAMKRFLSDFEAGKMQKRYLAYELPVLPFCDKAFDIALCSHFLFTYTDHLSFDFHYESIKEMSRVAQEVRIFPVLTLDGSVSKHLQPIIDKLSAQNINVSIEQVEYEFQLGGDKMLKIN